MTIFHRTKRTQAKKAGHLNYMGGRSFDVTDPLLQLRICAASSFFGEPKYYERDARDRRPHRYVRRLSDADLRHLRETLDGVDPVGWRSLTPAGRMEAAIDAALDHDAEATLAEAARLRTEDCIRTTPQVILVRAAHHRAVKGTGLVRRYAKQIIARTDEPSVGLAYQLHRYGKPIPNALKKAWRDALQGAKGYQLAKYRMDRRQVKTRDVVNLVHAKSLVVSRLMRGDLKVAAQGQDATWEAIISRQGSSKASWLQALEVMGHMALLRNLRNLLEAGVDPALFTERLVSGAATGKQLPFRYYSAFRAVEGRASGELKDALERCMLESVGHLPRFRGRVMSLCDNSGSAQGTTTSSMGTMQVSTIANLQAILTALVSDRGYVGVFGDRLTTFPVAQGASIFDELERAERHARTIGMATENGVWLFWDHAIRKRERWDHVFVYSDMQAGHGGLYGTRPSDYRRFAWKGSRYIDVAKLVAAYRREVNPQVHVHLVQVAGYQDTLVPEHYDRTTILGGWGDGLLRFAAKVAHARDGDRVVTPR